jgi:hypothetical protein
LVAIVIAAVSPEIVPAVPRLPEIDLRLHPH